jgi:hypothetical protein
MMRRCFWGLNVKQDGIGERCLHGSESFNLLKWAGLHARRSLSAGRDDDAFDAMLDVVALARHQASGQPMAVLKVIGFAIELQAIEFMASRLRTERSAAAKRLLGRLEALPSSPSVADAIRFEKQVHIDWIRANGMKGVEEFFAADMYKVSGARRELQRAFLGLSDENIPAICDAIDKVFEETAKIAEMPPDRYAVAEQAIRTRLEDELTTTRPIVCNVLPRLLGLPLSKLRLDEARVTTLRALFKTGLVLLVEGQDRLKDLTEPFGKSPPAFRRLKSGFELTSAMTTPDGKPIKLCFGTELEARK